MIIRANAMQIPLKDESVQCCECGCGMPVRGRYHRPGMGWRTQRFVSPSHSLRLHRHPGDTWTGRKHKDSSKAKLSIARKDFYLAHPDAKLAGPINPMFGKTGPLNPNYIDGSSPERQRAYCRLEGREFLKRVYARDGYKCRRCSAEKTGPRSIHAHHIAPWAGNPELRFDDDNAVTLCRPCHSWVHSKKNLNREFLVGR